MSRRLLGLKALAFKPKCIKVQSPPYPITGSEDIFQGGWDENDSSIELKTVVKRYNTTEEADFASSLGKLNLKSTVVEYDNANEPEQTDLSSSIVKLDLKSIIVEYSNANDPENSDLSSSLIKLEIRQVVVYSNQAAHPENTDLSSSIKRLALV